MRTLKDKDAYLVLGDGSVYCGKSFGAEGMAIGEIVCSTAVVGYQETLTDPCCFGQIVLQTFPLLGNYGVNSDDGESDRVYPSGYVVREKCDLPSNFRCEGTLDEYLKKNNVVGIYGIDTRALTRKIKDSEIINCVITTTLPENIEELLLKIDNYKITEAVEKVSCKEPYVLKCDNKRYTVCLYDYGVRRSMLDALLKHGCEVVVLPYNTPLDDALKYKPDGFVLSDGPGCPDNYTDLAGVIKEIFSSGIPVIGSGLGHQLAALANGGRVKKLPFGHRGANVPVTDVKNDKVYITSQNHGYAVSGDSISDEIGEISFINTNDKTCEGIIYKSGNAVTVQFRPDICEDTDGKTLFDEFICMMERRK